MLIAFQVLVVLCVLGGLGALLFVSRARDALAEPRCAGTPALPMRNPFSYGEQDTAAT